MLSKRVAVCFSGQIRDWHTATKNILHYFSTDHIANVTVDFFIHTWDINTWRKPKQHHHVFKNKPHKDLKKIVEAYKPKRYHMSSYDETRWPNSEPWDPLFYSFEYSVLLKQQYELENNFTYDVVVKARPDTVYEPQQRFPFEHRMPAGTCYTTTTVSKFPREFNKHCFDDVMFFGDSKTMDVMAGLYKYYAVKRKNNKDAMQQYEYHLGPGTLLYEYAVKNNIHPGSWPTSYAVIRSTMRDQGIDSVEDYDKIKKLWQEWYI